MNELIPYERMLNGFMMIGFVVTLAFLLVLVWWSILSDKLRGNKQ